MTSQFTTMTSPTIFDHVTLIAMMQSFDQNLVTVAFL